MKIPKGQTCKCWLDYPNANCKDWCAYYDNIAQRTSTRKTICRLKNYHVNQAEIDKFKAIEMLQARLACLQRTVNPNLHCDDNCDSCILTYQQGKMGEQIALCKYLINTLLQ